MEKPTMKSNYGLGPKTGNAAREGKRAAFKAGKEERSNLADSINSAFKARNTTVHINPKLEPVKEPIKAPKFAR